MLQKRKQNVFLNAAKDKYKQTNKLKFIFNSKIKVFHNNWNIVRVFCFYFIL